MLFPAVNTFKRLPFPCSSSFLTLPRYLRYSSSSSKLLSILLPRRSKIPHSRALYRPNCTMANAINEIPTAKLVDGASIPVVSFYSLVSVCPSRPTAPLRSPEKLTSEG